MLWYYRSIARLRFSIASRHISLSSREVVSRDVISSTLKFSPFESFLLSVLVCPLALWFLVSTLDSLVLLYGCYTRYRPLLVVTVIWCPYPVESPLVCV